MVVAMVIFIASCSIHCLASPSNVSPTLTKPRMSLFCAFPPSFSIVSHFGGTSFYILYGFPAASRLSSSFPSLRHRDSVLHWNWQLHSDSIPHFELWDWTFGSLVYIISSAAILDPYLWGSKMPLLRTHSHCAFQWNPHMMWAWSQGISLFIQVPT